MKRQIFAIVTAFTTLGLLASPISAQTLERTVSIKVIKAKEILPSLIAGAASFFDEFVVNGQLPDFYVVPTIDGKQLSKSRTISENNSPTFNHTVAAKVALGKARVPITLKLMESDTLDSDDTADISPISANEGLLLNYEPSTGKIYGPDGRHLGGRGQEITVQGDRSKHVARITFAISHQDATASSPQLPNDPSCPVASTTCQPK